MKTRDSAPHHPSLPPTSGVLNPYLWNALPLGSGHKVCAMRGGGGRYLRKFPNNSVPPPIRSPINFVPLNKSKETFRIPPTPPPPQKKKRKHKRKKNTFHTMNYGCGNVLLRSEERMHNYKMCYISSSTDELNQELVILL